MTPRIHALRLVRGILWMVALALLGVGCSTAPSFPPVDLAGPGWKSSEHPALWRARRGAPELTGELLVAVNGGERLVQFSKQGLPIVTAQVSRDGWRVSSALRAGSHTGRLPVPGQVLWFLVDGSPPRDPLPPPWTLTPGQPEGGWTLSNARSGETLTVGASAR